jgi:hypothetical protein
MPKSYPTRRAHSRREGGNHALVLEPRLDPRVRRGTDRLFAALAAARGARIFHPAGVAYRARFEALPTPAPAGVHILQPGFEHDALVRFSRGLGVPRPLPDFLGIAFRLPDAYRVDAHQDFLLASTGRRPFTNAIPLPSATFFGRAFSSLLPHAVAGKIALVGAFALGPERATGRLEPLAELEEVAAAGEVPFAVALGSATTRWRAVALLTITERLPRAEAAALRFNPWNTGGAIEPVWALNRLRDPAYRGSQAGRPASSE